MKPRLWTSYSYLVDTSVDPSLESHPPTVRITSPPFQNLPSPRLSSGHDDFVLGTPLSTLVPDRTRTLDEVSGVIPQTLKGESLSRHPS